MREKYRVRQWHFRCTWHLTISVIAATVAASRELICGRHVIENFGGQISTDVHIDHLVILRLRDFRTVEYYATATVHLPVFQMGRRPRWAMESLCNSDFIPAATTEPNDLPYRMPEIWLFRALMHP
jgi:hypothetical protein